jgi:hypothetical protein
MHTFTSALALVGACVPPHLKADADVPILCAPQAQGDLMIIPVEPAPDAPWQELPAGGLQVIHGEATGNTHWLHRGFDSPQVRWAPAKPGTGLLLGRVWVPAGQSALLIHTDEHGANGIGPGTYAIHRKRQLQLRAFRPDQATATRPISPPTSRNLRAADRTAWDYVYD